MLSCGHSFHRICILEWLFKHSNKCFTCLEADPFIDIDEVSIVLKIAKLTRIISNNQEGGKGRQLVDIEVGSLSNEDSLREEETEKMDFTIFMNKYAEGQPEMPESDHSIPDQLKRCDLSGI